MYIFLVRYAVPCLYTHFIDSVCQEGENARRLGTYIHTSLDAWCLWINRPRISHKIKRVDLHTNKSTKKQKPAGGGRTQSNVDYSIVSGCVVALGRLLSSPKLGCPCGKKRTSRMLAPLIECRMQRKESLHLFFTQIYWIPRPVQYW